MQGGASAVFMSGIQQYGYWQEFPEYSSLVGVPVAPPEVQASGVWMRRFSSALVLINPSTAPSPLAAALDPGYRLVPIHLAHGTNSADLPAGWLNASVFFSFFFSPFSSIT